MEASAGLANFEATAAAQNLIALAKGSEELQSFPQGFFGIPSLPYLGGAALGRKEGVYQLGSDVQTGWFLQLCSFVPFILFCVACPTS